MKKAADTPPFVSRGGELHLSNIGQMQLLRCAMERGIPLRMKVRGFSMAPFIRDEDVLTIVPLHGHGLRRGEVVAFVHPDSGRMTIHRAVSRQGAGWLMRGDNSPTSDGIIALENIIGRVTRVTRRGRAVRFGLGAEGALIAVLHRGDTLMSLKKLLRLPRRTAGTAVRWLQARAIYRALGKRYASHIEIVAAGADDVKAVHRYLNPAEPYSPDEPDLNVTGWVAKAGAKVIGFVQCVCHSEAHAAWTGCWLFSLTVWRWYRGLGIGESLTMRVIEHARAQGAPQLFLAVYDDNGSAIDMYHKLGFETTTLPALEPGLAAEAQQFGRRRIVMRKSLAAC